MRTHRVVASPCSEAPGFPRADAARPTASDVAATPVSGLAVQACGDARLSNSGGFGLAGRRRVFDVNDFDEMLPRPREGGVGCQAAGGEPGRRWPGQRVRRHGRITAAPAM